MHKPKGRSLLPKHLIIINGSYHEDGFTDFMLGIMKERLHAAGISVETLLLRDVPIEFCRNCRHCAKRPDTEHNHTFQTTSL